MFGTDFENLFGFWEIGMLVYPAEAELNRVLSGKFNSVNKNSALKSTFHYSMGGARTSGLEKHP